MGLELEYLEVEEESRIHPTQDLPTLVDHWKALSMYKQVVDQKRL